MRIPQNTPLGRHRRRVPGDCTCGARRFSTAHAVRYEVGYAAEILRHAVRLWWLGDV